MVVENSSLGNRRGQTSNFGRVSAAGSLASGRCPIASGTMSG